MARAAADRPVSHERRLSDLLGPASSSMRCIFRIRRGGPGESAAGWARPAFSRSQADMQHFYVNRRMVRDKLVRTRGAPGITRTCCTVAIRPCAFLDLAPRHWSMSTCIRPT